MKDKLIELLDVSTRTLSFEQIVMHIIIALILGFIIYISYYFSHEGTIYSKKFNVSLVIDCNW